MEAASRTRGAAVVAWSLAGLAAGLLPAGVLFSPSWGSDVGETVLYDLAWWAIVLSWAIVGALVASRQPRNPIGWIFCVSAVFVALTGPAEAYHERYFGGNGGSREIAEAAAWFSSWSWAPALLVPLVFVPLYFPDGRLPSSRWRVVAWLGAISIAAFSLSQAFVEGELQSREIENPYGIDHWLIELLAGGAIVTLGAIVAAVVSVVVRFRRAEGIERQQIKWLAYAASLAVLLLVSAGLIGGLWSSAMADALVLLAAVSLPVAVVVAILRYRLYDIDLLINRTLVYGGLTAGVVAIYVALVGGLAAFFHESADFWLALVATGLAALLVQPVCGPACSGV